MNLSFKQNKFGWSSLREVWFNSFISSSLKTVNAASLVLIKSETEADFNILFY